jgi:ribosome maturation factor RimP
MLSSTDSFRADRSEIGQQMPVAVPRVGARPLFLRQDPAGGGRQTRHTQQIRNSEQRDMTALQTDIEGRLAASEPEVEVLLAEVVGGRRLRVFIDHPQGVTLALCERVSAALNELRERYSLEVSSPGSERPLTKPAHFRRFVGRRARVRTRHPRPVGHSERASDASRPAGSFTGELVGASEEEVMLAAEEGIVAIPYAEIRRSNLVEE